EGHVREHRDWGWLEQPARGRAAVEHRPNPLLQRELVSEPLGESSADVLEGAVHGSVDRLQDTASHPELLEPRASRSVQYLTNYYRVRFRVLRSGFQVLGSWFWVPGSHGSAF